MISLQEGSQSFAMEFIIKGQLKVVLPSDNFSVTEHFYAHLDVTTSETNDL